MAMRWDTHPRNVPLASRVLQEPFAARACASLRSCWAPAWPISPVQGQSPARVGRVVLLSGVISHAPVADGQSHGPRFRLAVVPSPGSHTARVVCQSLDSASLSKNFLATHQLDTDCWNGLLCTLDRQECLVWRVWRKRILLANPEMSLYCPILRLLVDQNKTNNKACMVGV
jgi:hypothetical protein